MTAEVASNAGNLLSDIKPGYMLGAKPRQQAIGHCIGILSGALAATPLFFFSFSFRRATTAPVVPPRSCPSNFPCLPPCNGKASPT